VRELSNALEHMVVVDADGVLDIDDLPMELGQGARTDGEAPRPAGLDDLVGKSLDEIEKLFIAETLKLTGGNREEAAKMLGIGERTLYRKIDKYELQRPG
jgi:two-component system response regulator HydG